MKRLLATLLLLLSLSCFALAQDTWAVKAKVLPWLLIGSGMNYTLGVEYGFHKVHAIGVDFEYSDFSAEHDVYDTTRHESVSGPRMFTVSRALFFNYRRYLSFEHTLLQAPFGSVFNDNYLPYVGGFARYGKTDKHAQTGLITTQLAYDEWQYSAGVLFGVISKFVDVNIGPFYKTRYIRDVEMAWGAPSIRRSSYGNFGLRIGADIYLVAKKNSNHRSAVYGNTWEREYCEEHHKNKE